MEALVYTFLLVYREAQYFN
nr:photosystem II protein T [Solanum medians]